MWAQDWSNIFDLLVPYPNATSPNLTALLIQNNYTVIKMFKVVSQSKNIVNLTRLAFKELFKLNMFNNNKKLSHKLYSIF